MEDVNLFGFIAKQINKTIEPPYYYPSVTKYTKFNFSKIIDKMSEQLLKQFCIEDINNVHNFLSDLTKEKQQQEFKSFIIGGYKTENEIHIAIKTEININ